MASKSKHGPVVRFPELLPQIQLTSDQKEGIYRYAAETNMTVSEVVREAIDQYLANLPTRLIAEN